MFRAKVEKLIDLRNLIDVLWKLIPEVNLEISPRGIIIQANDAVNVVQVTAKLARASFEEFSCTGEFVVGLSLRNLSTLLRLGNATDSVIISASREDSMISLEFSAKDYPRKFEFKMNTMVLDLDVEDMSQNKYSARIFAYSRPLQSMIKELSAVSPDLAISVNNARIKLSVKSDAAGGNIDMRERNGEGLKISADRNVRIDFSMKYLKKVMKAARISEIVKISLEEDVAAQFLFQGRLGDVRYFLAPLIDDSD